MSRSCTDSPQVVMVAKAEAGSAAGFKAGRVLSTKNETKLREAHDQLNLAAG